MFSFATISLDSGVTSISILPSIDVDDMLIGNRFISPLL